MALAACASSGAHGSQHPSAPTPTATQAAPAGATVTATKIFAPYGPDGAAAAGVTAHRPGSCFTTSIAVSAPLAYRCFAGNALLDPCFARSRTATSLLCFTSPWSSATELRLTGALPTAAPLAIRRPWAIELAGGDRCVAVTGTTDVVRGVALGYRCGGGQAGLRDGSGALAHVLFRGTDGTVRDVTVVTEWKA